MSDQSQYNFDAGRKKIITDNLLKSYGIDQSIQNTDNLEKSNENQQDTLEKGGKRAVIGEKREFGGRMYVKTANGWKFFGKGKGVKAQDHHESSASKSEKVDQRKSFDMKNDDGQGRAYLKTRTLDQLSKLKANIENIEDNHPASLKTSKSSKNYYSWIQDEIKSRKSDTPKKEYSFTEVLADKEGKSLIEALEHGSSDPAITKDLKKQLKDKFGYDYKE